MNFHEIIGPIRRPVGSFEYFDWKKIIRNQDWEFLKTSDEQLKFFEPKICSPHVFKKNNSEFLPLFNQAVVQLITRLIIEKNSENSEWVFLWKDVMNILNF